ncbi:MAG: hypothetical protein M3Z46_08430 [Actinomycetota bacterium]|nr:hypothetical protein [Actinomycetota bacterium]
MDRLILVVALVLLALGIAAILRRRGADAPTRGASWATPTQLDRADFERPDTDWLVAVFSSATCLSCQSVWTKAEQMRSDVVAVQEVQAVEHRALHQRYGVEAVPMVLVADRAGAVCASFLGEPTATDLWATVAELREPGSTPDECDHGLS